MRLTLSLVTAKTVDFIIRILSLGAGSTWPGHIALAIDPHILKKLTKGSGVEIILVAGTNGKTTTALIIKSILSASGKTVFHNEEGANLVNGVVTAFIRNATVSGTVRADVAVLEVDENALPLVLHHINPRGILLLNLFRDQLDRYGEVDIIADKWKKALSKLTKHTTVIFNADDPQLAYLSHATKARLVPFTIDAPHFHHQAQSHDVDSTYCPDCGTKLEYSAYSYSHLGYYVCKKCSFARPNKIQDYSHFLSHSHLKGIYNAYNVSAAVALVKSIFTRIDADIIQALKSMQPAFGRQEIIKYKGKKVLMLLSKNPVGFNQSIHVAGEVLSDKNNRVLVCLNDRIPDGRDVSWIWDVEFENLYQPRRPIYVSGDRAYDMGLRFQYCMKKPEKSTKSKASISIKNIHVYPQLGRALDAAVGATDADGMLVVLATYSAMLEVREILVGRKLM